VTRLHVPGQIQTYSNTSICHRCHQPIVWALSERNKRMPLEEANGRDQGLFVLRRRHRLGPPEAIAVGPALFDDETKYVYHQCSDDEGYDPAKSAIPY